MDKKPACVLVFGLVLLFAAKDARATLAGDAASIAANERALGGRRSVVALAGMTRHDLVLPSGGVVREFVSPSGVVFAVRWEGPGAPNLRELLGPRFEDLRKHPLHGPRHSVSASFADWKMRAWNHRHLFGGLVWVPSLVPQGVDVDALEAP